MKIHKWFNYDFEDWAKHEVPIADNDWNYKCGKREGLFIGAKAHRDGLIPKK
jgi:hypothetical protein